MVMADEDAQVCRSLKALLDPRIASSPDLAMVEIRFRGVDGDDRDAVDTLDGVAVAEQLLEVDVADVARIVVPRDHDDVLAVDRVEVALRERVLLLEPERRQVSRADDDVRLQVVDLGDRALEEVRQEELRPTVQIRDLDDREGSTTGRHARSVGRSGKRPISASGPVATLIQRD